MKKAIKKIVALGLGASMVGATLMGAAADLNDFPAPFVQGGQFSGTLVVGDNAAAQDVVGVSDVAMSLQYASSVKAGSGSSATTTVEGDAYRVADSGDALNLYQDLDEVTAVLDDTDLNALADGTFKAKTTVGYTQTWTMPANAEVQFVVDPDATVEDPQLFLKVPSGDKVLDYQLSFTTSPESDYDSDAQFEDWEDNKISILGKEYTVTKAENQTSAATTGFKLTLMGGAIQDTLEVGQTKTYTINGKDYEVTVMVVSGDTSAAAVTKMIVNDEVTKSLSKDETYTLKDGIDVGIKEVLPTKSGDVVQNLVEFYLGAEKVVLDGKNNKLEIGDETISDVTVTITGQKSDVGKLSTIDIEWTPTEDYYVPVGGVLSEAITDNSDYTAFLNKVGIDFAFEGLEASTVEDVKFSPSGKRNYKIEFTNRKGVKYSQKVFYIGDSDTAPMATLGEDASDPLYVKEGDYVCDNDYFVVENNKNSRILRMMDISTSDSQVNLKDMGTGDTQSYTYVETGSSNISTFVMDGASYQLNVTAPFADCLYLLETTDDTSGRASLWTQFDTEIDLYNYSELNAGDGAFNLSSTSINITEDIDGKEESSSDVDTLRLNFTYDSSDGLDLTGSVFSTQDSATSGTYMLNLDSDDNVYEGYTEWGNFIKQRNTDNQDEWQLSITKEEAVAKVFLTAGTTAISTMDGASGDTVILSRIDVGATKLASEVAGMEKSSNLILVGGPCANAAVEAASADFPTCGDWPLDAGEAIVQLVEQDSGNVALLIAGTMAADTRAATGIVSEMTELKALPDGVMSQKIVVSTGTLMDMPEVMEEEVMEEDAMEEDAVVEE